MEATDQSPGLDFSFGSFVFQDAFKKLSTSLRWMFWGTVLQLVGFASLAAPVAALMIPGAGIAQQIGRPQLALLLPGGLFLASIGGIVVILGEQKCLHLKLPLGMTRSLPGHHWLRGAYWFHLGSWLLRLARNFLGRGLVGPILIPMQLIGFGLLLLFLRKMADCLARPDLRRRVDLILAIGGCTLLIGALLIFDHKLKLNVLRPLPKPAALALLATPLVLVVTGTLAYLLLLFQLSNAAAGFAKYLGVAQQFGDELSPADDEVGEGRQDAF